ncbi:MAG TPA: serine/threonine-protein kinase, partial [Pirellulaceae bacterium]|nr:serine/threonine-protein kinase [Pirellulaceae bacterium]
MSPNPSQHEHSRSGAPPAQASGNTPPNGSFIGSDTSPVLASLASTASVLPIARLKQYRLLELIGRGGMGDVYRAHDETFDRIVAIKVLPADLAEDESFVHRFQREAKAIAGLSHPHIVPVYEIDQVDGCCYFAMQLVEGESLERRLRRVKQLSLDETLRIISACLSALETAHAKGLIHRDIKPGNLL